MLAATVVVLVALTGAASAQATVTRSAITSPADPFYGFDQGQSQSVTISGTSDGTASDAVDIDCYVDDGSTGSLAVTANAAEQTGVVAADVPVAAGGTFTTTVPLSALERGEQEIWACRLRAVPRGTAPSTGLASYSGPRTLVGTYLPLLDGATQYDYLVQEPQLGADDLYRSIGSCGLFESVLGDPTVFDRPDSTSFYCPRTISISSRAPHMRTPSATSSPDRRPSPCRPPATASRSRRTRPPRS